MLPAPPPEEPLSRGLHDNRLPTTRHRGRRWPSYVPLQGPLPEAHVLSLSEEQGVSLSTTLQLLLLLLLLQLAHSLVRRQLEMQKHSRVPHIHVVAVFLLRRTRFLLRAANSAVGDVEAADHKSQQGRPRFKSLCNSALPTRHRNLLGCSLTTREIILACDWKKAGTVKGLGREGA